MISSLLGPHHHHSRPSNSKAPVVFCLYLPRTILTQLHRRRYHSRLCFVVVYFTAIFFRLSLNDETFLAYSLNLHHPFRYL